MRVGHLEQIITIIYPVQNLIFHPVLAIIALLSSPLSNDMLLRIYWNNFMGDVLLKSKESQSCNPRSDDLGERIETKSDWGKKVCLGREKKGLN